MVAVSKKSPASIAGQPCVAMNDSHASTGQTSAVRLIDRRTGQTHYVNGSPLIILTRRPDTAAAELLSGRDAAVWEVRVDPIGRDAAVLGVRA